MTWIQLIPDHIQRTMGADELTGEVGQVGQEICDGTARLANWFCAVPLAFTIGRKLGLYWMNAVRLSNGDSTGETAMLSPKFGKNAWLAITANSMLGG